MKNDQIGGWAFIIGLVIAVLAGLVTVPAYLSTWVLVILGLIVGFLNIGDKEITAFLIATIALLVVGGAGLSAIPTVGGYLESVLTFVVVFVAPASVVVAVKQVYNIAK